NALRSALKPVVLALARLWLLAAWGRRVSFAPDMATYNSLSIPGPQSAVADVDDGLGDLIVRLEVALRRDHVHQRGGRVDVRLLDRAGLDPAEAGVAGHAGHRRAGGVGG